MIQNPKSKIPKLYLIILMLVGVLGLVFTHTDVIAWYSAKYTDSAHGNTTYGVNRLDVEHPIGDCANCHDPNGPDACVNELMLFAPMNQDSQTDNFCFQCHKGTGSAQVGGITNYDYSKNFGGGYGAIFNTIYDAFNPTIGATPSSHNLADIQNYVTGKVGFTSNTNPCVVCHNPHTAQRNYPVVLSGKGGVKTAVRLVAHYEDLNTNLWGDEDYATSGYDELMKDVTPNYQAPYYMGKTDYEPANNSTADGSNLPNFVVFCWKCHQNANVTSTEHGILKPVNWTNSTAEAGTRNMHGLAHDSSNGYGSTIAPYIGGETKNYVLACTDCHEPHGSRNEWLLRSYVNGKGPISVPQPGQWWGFCTACHELTIGHEGMEKHDCRDCHDHNTNNEGYF